ncbi:hypothetical protein HK096_003147 [Nowakowskiella sp. JEL0078]|nr:hypothetical protein HK096_003147 [Nowakowskiella sp. JEL0078]
MKLTPAVLSSRIPPGKKLQEVAEINCSSLEISHIEDISVAVNLHKLNLSNNTIKSSEALSGIQYNSEITWLNLSNNELESMEGVEKLKKLLALILSNNEIKRIENLSTLKNLGTLVISHNKVDEINGLTGLKSLNKLSAAHNNIRTFPDLSVNIEIQELKLNDNKLSVLPDDRLLPLSGNLKILDLGNNLFRSFADIVSLASLRNLVNLNLKGNPLCTQEGYKERVLALVPTVRILDGERFDEKFLKRKQKKQAMVKKLEIKEKKTEKKVSPVAEEESGSKRSEALSKKRMSDSETSTLDNGKRAKTSISIKSKTLTKPAVQIKSVTSNKEQTNDKNNSKVDNIFMEDNPKKILKNRTIPTLEDGIKPIKTTGAKTLNKVALMKVSKSKTQNMNQYENNESQFLEDQTTKTEIKKSIHTEGKFIDKKQTESILKPAKINPTQLTTVEGRSGVVSVVDVAKQKKDTKVSNFNPTILVGNAIDERLGLQRDIGGWD